MNPVVVSGAVACPDGRKTYFAVGIYYSSDVSKKRDLWSQIRL